MRKSRALATRSYVPLQVNVLGLVKLNFKGEIRVRVEAALPPSLSLGGVLGGVHLRVIGLEVSADSPVLGRVTISQRDIDVTPLSLLEIISIDPADLSADDVSGFHGDDREAARRRARRHWASRRRWCCRTRRRPCWSTPTSRSFRRWAPFTSFSNPSTSRLLGDPSQVLAQLQQFPVTVTHVPVTNRPGGCRRGVRRGQARMVLKSREFFFRRGIDTGGLPRHQQGIVCGTHPLLQARGGRP